MTDNNDPIVAGPLPGRSLTKNPSPVNNHYQNALNYRTYPLAGQVSRHDEEDAKSIVRSARHLKVHVVKIPQLILRNFHAKFVVHDETEP